MRVCVCRSVSQPVLTQLPTLSATVGSLTRLTCPLSSGFHVGSYDIYSFKQQPGSPPQCLMGIYSDLDKHQGFRVLRCFHGSKDALANTGFLLISRLQAEDETGLYCDTHGGGSSYHSSQCLISQGSETWNQRPCLSLMPHVLRSFCAGSCRGESPVGRPVLDEGGVTHRLCCCLSQHMCPRSSPR